MIVYTWLVRRTHHTWDHESCAVVSQSTHRKAVEPSHEDDDDMPYGSDSAHADAVVTANKVWLAVIV